eukprot:m.168570 g.168570  ORF g.168570 m.168570 type:complete len:450 (-) comp17219_c0_seq2:933-2282(-)
MLCAPGQSSLGNDSHPTSPSHNMLSPSSCGLSAPPSFTFTADDTTVPATSTSNAGSRHGSRHASRPNSRRGSHVMEPSEVIISADGICLFREDRFVQGKLLGRGSFSLVHEAVDKATSRRVALKTLLIADADKVHRQRYAEAQNNRVLHPKANNANTTNNNTQDHASPQHSEAVSSGSQDSDQSDIVCTAEDLVAEGIRPCSMQDALRELEVANLLHHPNIAAIYGYFLLGKDCLVMVQELCTVGDIFTIMNPDGLAPVVSATLMPQALAGLAYMHSQQLVHMDLKPENMLISRGNVLKICDFGSVAKSGIVLEFAIGTMQYVSPELVHACRTGRPIRAHTSMDMFALGQILFIVLTGRFMWECAAEPDVNYRLFATGQHRRRRPWCVFPDALRTFLESLVQTDHQARPSALEAKEFVDNRWLAEAQEFKNRMRVLAGPKSQSSKSGTL